MPSHQRLAVLEHIKRIALKYYGLSKSGFLRQWLIYERETLRIYFRSCGGGQFEC